MRQRTNRMQSEHRKAAELGGGFIAALVLGAVGGALCGAAILSFGALIGRSGTTGTEYVGYWESVLIWLGFLYGGLLGVFVAPIAYFTMVRVIGFKRAIPTAMFGTIVGGFLGAVAGPPFAVITGVTGFFMALARSKYKVVREVDAR